MKTVTAFKPLFRLRIRLDLHLSSLDPNSQYKSGSKRLIDRENETERKTMGQMDRETEKKRQKLRSRERKRKIHRGNETERKTMRQMDGETENKRQK